MGYINDILLRLFLECRPPESIKWSSGSYITLMLSRVEGKRNAAGKMRRWLWSRIWNIRHNAAFVSKHQRCRCWHPAITSAVACVSKHISTWGLYWYSIKTYNCLNRYFLDQNQTVVAPCFVCRQPVRLLDCVAGYSPCDLPGTPVGRNLSGLLVRCSNSKSGCDYMGNFGDVREHEIFSCPYRPLECPSISCSKVFF